MTIHIHLRMYPSAAQAMSHAARIAQQIGGILTVKRNVLTIRPPRTHAEQRAHALLRRAAQHPTGPETA